MNQWWLSVDFTKNKAPWLYLFFKKKRIWPFVFYFNSIYEMLACDGLWSVTCLEVHFFFGSFSLWIIWRCLSLRSWLSSLSIHASHYSGNKSFPFPFLMTGSRIDLFPWRSKLFSEEILNTQCDVCRHYFIINLLALFLDLKLTGELTFLLFSSVNSAFSLLRLLASPFLNDGVRWASFCFWHLFLGRMKNVGHHLW